MIVPPEPIRHHWLTRGWYTIRDTRTGNSETFVSLLALKLSFKNLVPNRLYVIHRHAGMRVRFRSRAYLHLMVSPTGTVVYGRVSRPQRKQPQPQSQGGLN